MVNPLQNEKFPLFKHEFLTSKPEFWGILFSV